MKLTTVLGAIVVAFISACTPLSLSPSPTEALVLEPSNPPPSKLLPELGDLLVLRAFSGPFVDHAERIEEASPEVAVFDDGLVVARIEDEYRAIQLTDDEMEEVSEELELANVEPLAAGGAVDAIPFGCADCAVTVIRTDVGGDTVEAAAYGLDTDLPDSYVSGLPYPRGLVAVSRLLDALRDRFASADSIPFSGELPMVPVAPFMGG